MISSRRTGLLACPILIATAFAGEIEFNSAIRPILSDKCYTCHGPDQAQRKSKLRFDTEEGAKQDLGGRFAIVPGDPAKSLLIQRITADKPAMRMPPVYSGRTLSEKEIGLLREWVAQGAQWQKHWSFIPPKRPEYPPVRNTAWPRNGIDRFVLAKLEQAGLTPSPEADRAILLRRVTLDLTGLPPTPSEIDAFLADKSPQAYEKVVDRLLASPRYGERMAVQWLNAARYADTQGYQTDGERFMWRWRDWVIDAFNHNMPFDQFTVEQIAGDLLPHATTSQRVATGFNRNHRSNSEGGIIPEEYAAEYVMDRVETTSTVWLGVTLGCARCHDHKYDPLSQKDFYKLSAYFNNIPEQGKVRKYGNSPPVVVAPTAAQQTQLEILDTKVSVAAERFQKMSPEVARTQRSWEKSLLAAPPLDWNITESLSDRFPKLEDLHFDGKAVTDCGDVAHFGFGDKFTFGLRMNAEAPDGGILSRGQDAAEGEGYSVVLKDGKIQVNLVKRWLDDALRVETVDTAPLKSWHHLAVSYDGSRLAAGIRIYLDGKPQKIHVLLDDLNQSFATDEPLRIGAGGGPQNRFHGKITGIRVYQSALPPEDVAVLADNDSISSIAAIQPEKRAASQVRKIDLAYLDRFAPEPMRQAWRQWRDALTQRAHLMESLPTVMVMEDRPTPRDTFVLIRGAYDRPGAKVDAGTPSVLPPLLPQFPNNRLGLAKWLVDPSNPLTARVAVNRLWQMNFGIGLVKTVEDFGSQGEWPSDPAMLDWLATEFVRIGWDTKTLQKTIVMSATYRQSSKATPELLQRDPENRLLARGSRYRLPAEMVRDQALAISGLLVEKLGGPSVKPYQPAGLWKELSASDYDQGKGADLYRRSLYTFWKRTIAPPSMSTFDAASRETCNVRESRTNTPLQALDLMNDVTYIEASRVLAQRIMAEGGATPESRLAYAFRLATSHLPSPAQSRMLAESFRYYLDAYRTDPRDAEKLLSQGESPRNPHLDTAELAAYAMASSLILNLDETVSKQ